MEPAAKLSMDCPESNLKSIKAVQRFGISLSTGQLENMAKLAWRNNARCIGRLFWESLHLFDARSVDSPEGIVAGHTVSIC